MRHSIKTVVQTESARKYLQQLCKHFAHKVPASWTEEAGSVTFPYGDCTMQATESELVIQCETGEPGNIALLKDVIESHLQKFAWRETPHLVWQEHQAAAS